MRKIRKLANVFAHRGGLELGHNSQNTMSAFEASYKAGIRYFETDVILTADGKVVAFHGSQSRLMEKKTGLPRRKKTQQLTFEELHKIAGSPLLIDLLNRFPDVFFSIDSKTNEVVQPLVDAVLMHKADMRVCITSFRLRRAVKARKLLIESDSKYDRASLCIYELPMRLVRFFPKAVFNYWSKRGIKTVQAPYRQVTPEVIAAAKQNNIAIYAWTVNDIDSKNRLNELGVDGIISDYPSRLIKA